jgi:phage host-nuclease inhibitor protein Gam
MTNNTTEPSFGNPTKHDIEFSPFVQAFQEEKPEGQNVPFVIDSETGANWYLRKMNLFDAEKAILKAQYEQRIAEIDADKKRLENLYQGQLEAWARREGETRRRKTITLPMGTISFRTVPAHVKLCDIDAAINEVKEWDNQQMRDAANLTEKIVWEIDKKAYLEMAQEQIETNGVTLPGCEWIPTRESVSIKTATKKGDQQDAETIEQDKARA